MEKIHKEIKEGKVSKWHHLGCCECKKRIY